MWVSSAFVSAMLILRVPGTTKTSIGVYSVQGQVGAGFGGPGDSGKGNILGHPSERQPEVPRSPISEGTHCVG